MCYNAQKDYFFIDFAHRNRKRTTLKSKIWASVYFFCGIKTWGSKLDWWKGEYCNLWKDILMPSCQKVGLNKCRKIGTITSKVKVEFSFEGEKYFLADLSIFLRLKKAKDTKNIIFFMSTLYCSAVVASSNIMLGPIMFCYQFRVRKIQITFLLTLIFITIFETKYIPFL